jgi:predicted transcriptional regulator
MDMLKNQKRFLLLILAVFIISELIDDFLDHLLGSSLFHSFFQMIFFLLLFLMVAQLFMIYHKRKIDRLLPQELMEILRLIKEHEEKMVMINKKRLMQKLNITKPTLQKRLNSLRDLKYVNYYKKGNNNYIRLTPLGDSLLE